MRYTYELYDCDGIRVDVTTNIAEVPKEVVKRKLFSFVVNVTDNVSGKEVYKTDSLNNLEAWYEQACMGAQWSNKETKEKNRKAIKTNGCPVCKQPWNPFNEQETDIHIKTTPSSPKTLCELLDDTNTELVGEAILRDHKLVDNNLKTAAAVGKPQMSGIPPIAIMALGMAMQDGVNKYGLFNWRETGVTASVFYDAMLRHILAWYSGEEHAPDSSIVHLGHLMAGAAILLDADYHNVLNDDRVKGKSVTVESLAFIRK